MTTQYRPISPAETVHNSALSLKLVRDTADNINNFKKFVGPGPIFTDMFLPAIQSPSASTTKTAVAPPTPLIYIPQGFDYLRFYARMQRTAGSGDTYWTLHIASSVYNGDEYYDSDYHNDVFTTLFTCDSNTADIYNGTLAIPPNAPGRYYSLLWTAENSDVSTRSSITSLSCFPVIVYG